MKKILTASTGLALVLFATASFAQGNDPATLSGDANRGRLQLSQSLDKIAFERLAARRSAVAAITTRPQAEARQQQLRRQIITLLGDLPGATPLNARILGTTRADGFRMEKLIFESLPNYRVTAILYVPDTATAGKKLPAIVVSPGHSPAGKASDYPMASAFARNGFIVLSYDIVGEGERLQYPDPKDPAKSLTGRPTGEHGLSGLQPTLIGDAVTRYFIWDAMRAVDYLASRPEVDASRIGAFGCSGGGAVTAMLGALDTRVKAIAPACYITSFDELLPTAGPQEAEQSIPGFIASGLDLADWVELAAPRPYAVISTASDMFPYAGAKASVKEARRFYSIFDPSAAGVSSGRPEPGVPTGPTINPDTANNVPASAPLQWITGIGRHGNLRPLEQQIVEFFLVHLAQTSASAYMPEPAGATEPAADALKVTKTGQVLTSYPNSETIHTINLKRYTLLPKPGVLSADDLAKAVRDVTHAVAKPGDPDPVNKQSAPLVDPPEGKEHLRHRFTLATAPGITIDAEFYRPANGKHPGMLILKESLDPSLEASRTDEIRSLRKLADSGTAVLVIAPRPSPPGSEEMKAPQLGTFYLTTLRAELVDKTLLGLRVDDVISAVNFMSHGTTVDPSQLSARASGHLGLVLLHAAVLDDRLKHVTVDHVLTSYRELIAAPIPDDAAEDILPGVIRHYDIPDLIRVLGTRVTMNAPRSMTTGSERLSAQDGTLRADLCYCSFVSTGPCCIRARPGFGRYRLFDASPHQEPTWPRPSTKNSGCAIRLRRSTATASLFASSIASILYRASKSSPLTRAGKTPSISL